MKDYKAIFEGAESTLFKVGSRKLHADRIRAELDKYKYSKDRAFTDADYFQILIAVVFYSGFKAATVDAKLPVIRQHFPDYESVAGYGEAEIKKILSDGKMLRNEKKIRACVENARTFRDIVAEFDSFRNYIESFAPDGSFENLMLLKEELEYRFQGIGKITTYHVLTEIGLPVLKPDRVICRIFRRLGLIESDEQLLKTIIQGRRFASATGHPIRYIDIVFVAYGQMKYEALGLERGICTEENPGCSVCGITGHCDYYKQRYTV